MLILRLKVYFRLDSCSLCGTVEVPCTVLALCRQSRGHSAIRVRDGLDGFGSARDQLAGGWSEGGLPLSPGAEPEPPDVGHDEKDG